VKHGLVLSTNTELVNRTILPQPLIELLPEEHQNFLNQHRSTYSTSMNHITQMVNDGLMISAPPIKKQTLAEKKHTIKNYQHLLKVYNLWIEHNPDMGQPLTNDTLDQFANIEKIRWTPSSSGLVVSAEQNSR
jgi:hypothetical protein